MRHKPEETMMVTRRCNAATVQGPVGDATGELGGRCGASSDRGGAIRAAGDRSFDTRD